MGTGVRGDGQRYSICSENSRLSGTQWLRRIFKRCRRCLGTWGSRCSEEDVLAKTPWGAHLAQANPTYPMRRLDEAWRCLQAWAGGLVEGPAFSWATSLFQSWWWLMGHPWERRCSPVWGGHAINPVHLRECPLRQDCVNNAHVAQPRSSLMEGWQVQVPEYGMKDWHLQGQLSVGIRFSPAVWYHFHSTAFHAASH